MGRATKEPVALPSLAETSLGRLLPAAQGLVRDRLRAFQRNARRMGRGHAISKRFLETCREQEQILDEIRELLTDPQNKTGRPL